MLKEVCVSEGSQVYGKGNVVGRLVLTENIDGACEEDVQQLEDLGPVLERVCEGLGSLCGAEAVGKGEGMEGGNPEVGCQADVGQVSEIG